MDGHAVDTRFAAVLDAVVVEVFPDEIAELSGLQNACVDGLIATAPVEDVGSGLAGEVIGIAVVSIGRGRRGRAAVDVGARQHIA